MTLEITIEDVPEKVTLVVRETVKFEDISAAMPKAFAEAFSHLWKVGATPLGPPFALYHSWEGGEVDMECGAIIASPVDVEGRLSIGSIPGGRMATAMHVGPYDKLVETYTTVMEWMKANGYEPADWMWEQYLTDPQAENDPSKWMTKVYWPLK